MIQEKSAEGYEQQSKKRNDPLNKYIERQKKYYYYFK